jgi:hypothetical protein
MIPGLGPPDAAPSAMMMMMDHDADTALSCPSHAKSRYSDNGRTPSAGSQGMISLQQSFPNTTTRAPSFTTDGTPKRKRIFPDDSYFELGSPSSPSPSQAVRRRRRYTTNAATDTITATTRHAHAMDGYPLPITLQKILEEEYTWITLKGFHTDCGTQPRPLRKLHHLPATVTIQHVLEHFQNKYKSQDDDEIRKGHIQRFCIELEQWCDSYLPTLLYPEELPQYHFWKNMTTMTTTNARYQTQQQQEHHQQQQGLRVCQVYGCHILLRLIVKTPPSLSPILRDSSSMADLIALLQKNRQVCFRRSYREPLEDELLDWEKAIMKMEKPLLDWEYNHGATTAATTAMATGNAPYRYDKEHEEMAMAMTPPKKKRFDGTEE